MVTKRPRRKKRSWTVAGAKAHLSEVIDRAEAEGPQTITRRGREAVVVVAADQWRRRTRRKGSFAEFLLRSPLAGSEVDVRRLDEEPRELDL